MRFVRPVVRTVGGITGTVRDMARLQEVARILIRHGLGFILTNQDIPGLKTPIPTRFEGTPQRTVAALQELGPTFIKLGQVLSTRPDLLPPSYIEALQTLQDKVTPVPLEDIETQLIQQLGEGWRARFEHFDDTPLATASIAQVHRARLIGGREVVLKVQRPGIGKKIEADIHILHQIGKRVTTEFPEAHSLDFEGVLREFERSIRCELDFTAEASNVKRFLRNFQGVPNVKFPEVIDEMTTAKVLCLEFLDGLRMRDAREAGVDMDLIGQRYLDLAYTMLFDHGYFHGDLHPGNVMVLPDHTIGVVDFGMVGQLTREMKDSLISLLFALERGDHRTIARIFFNIAVKSERVDYDAFEQDVVAVVGRNWSGVSVRDMQIGRFLMDVTQQAIRHKVRAPHGYTMFFKALLTTEGLAKSLIPEIDPLAAAKPYVERLIAERYSPGRVQEDLFYNLVTVSALGRRLPRTLTQLLDDVDKQRLKLNVELTEDRRAADQADRRQNRMILTLFSITAVSCGTIATAMDVWQVGGVSVLGLIFYAVAAPMFLVTMTMALRNRG